VKPRRKSETRNPKLETEPRTAFVFPTTRVMPNRNTVGLFAVLLAMWYAGVTQNNGAAYLLCFVFLGVSLVSIVHAWANLRGIAVEAHVLRAAFAGEEFAVNVRISSARRRDLDGIYLLPADGGTSAHFPLVAADAPADGRLTVIAARRGVFATLRLQIESNYPLGFFTARSTGEVAAPHTVYPAPRGELPLPISVTAARSGSGGLRAEGDDFAGVRAWRAGESQRHIDWKAVARGQPLVIKEWSGDTDGTVLLAWESLGDLPTETRLSQLARWIAQAERGGQLYALRLPGVQLPAARGEAHYHACLRRLAEFPAEVEA